MLKEALNYNKNIKYEKEVKKVRAIVENNNKILLVKHGDLFMLPGGKVEKNESNYNAIIREISEKSRITLNENIKPFIKIIRYDENYLERSTQIYTNRITNTIYYYAKTNKNINRNNMKLTPSEQKNNYKINYFSIEEIMKILKYTKVVEPKRKIFDEELFVVLNNFEKLKNKNKDDDFER